MLPAVIARLVHVLICAEAITFMLAALLHLRVPIPLVFNALDEPLIIPAAVAEGLIGASLAISGYAAASRRAWAWPTAVAAHTFAVLVGQFS